MDLSPKTILLFVHKKFTISDFPIFTLIFLLILLGGSKGIFLKLNTEGGKHYVYSPK